MFRMIKCTVIVLASVMSVCTLFFSLKLFISFPKAIITAFEMISIISCLMEIVVILFEVVVFKVVFKSSTPILFDNHEARIWEIITLATFFIYAVCFGVKTEIIEHWVRGSECYVNAMTPAILPWLSCWLFDISEFLNR